MVALLQDTADIMQRWQHTFFDSSKITNRLEEGMENKFKEIDSKILETKVVETKKDGINKCFGILDMLCYWFRPSDPDLKKARCAFFHVLIVVQMSFELLTGFAPPPEILDRIFAYHVQFIVRIQLPKNVFGGFHEISQIKDPTKICKVWLKRCIHQGKLPGVLNVSTVKSSDKKDLGRILVDCTINLAHHAIYNKWLRRINHIRSGYARLRSRIHGKTNFFEWWTNEFILYPRYKTISLLKRLEDAVKISKTGWYAQVLFNISLFRGHHDVIGFENAKPINLVRAWLNHLQENGFISKDVLIKVEPGRSQRYHEQLDRYVSDHVIIEFKKEALIVPIE